MGLIGVNRLRTTDFSTGLALVGPVQLTFRGIDLLLLATQNGPINLGADVSINGPDRVFVYARGTTGELSVDSNITANDDIRLWSEDAMAINGNLRTTNFSAYSGGSYSVGSGTVHANGIYITSLTSLLFETDRYPVSDLSDISLSLAADQLNIRVGSDGSVFSHAAAVFAGAESINISPATEATATIETNGSEPAVFAARTGGLYAPAIYFRNVNLQLLSGADINIGGTSIIPDSMGVTTIVGLIDAAQAFSSVGDVEVATLRAGTTINVGGNWFGVDIIAGNGIDVAGRLEGFGRAEADGDITADTIAIPEVLAYGDLRAMGGGIRPFVASPGGASREHTIEADRVFAPAGIDFSGNQFGGIDGLFSGGHLTMDLASVRFDPEVELGGANFNGADGNEFTNSPADGRGGSGGTFTVRASGQISVYAPITATTGLNRGPASFGGDGGTVSLDAGSSLTVSNTIQVSSNDVSPTQSPEPLRRSESGGMIQLHSRSTLTLTDQAHLLALLDDNAPGAGGRILLATDGSDIRTAGELVADRGVISLSNLPNNPGQAVFGATVGPLISIEGGSMRAETLTVAAMGDFDYALDVAFDLQVVSLEFSVQHDLNAGDLISAIGELTPVVARNSRGNVTIEVGGNASFNRVRLARANGGQSDGVNLSLRSDGNLSVRNEMALLTDASGMAFGGHISVYAGQQLTIGSLQAYSYVNNDLGFGARMSFYGDAGITLGATDLQVLVGSSATVNDGAEIILSSLGAINSPSAAPFNLRVQNQGHISSGGNILVDAGSFTGGGIYDFSVDNTSPRSIDHGGNISVTTTNDFRSVVDGTMDFRIANLGGLITDGGSILIKVGGQLETGTLRSVIDNRDGNINSGGRIDFQISGGFLVHGSALFNIFRDAPSFLSFGPQGAVAPYLISLDAASITADSLDAFVDDSAGAIPPSGFSGLAHISSGAIGITNRLNVFGLVESTGIVDAGTLSSTTVVATSAIHVGEGGLQPFAIGSQRFPTLQHTLTAPLIVSLGGILFDGNAGSAEAGIPGGDGGLLSLNANALNFGPDGDIQGPVTLSGGEAGGVSPAGTPVPAGSGGTFSAKTTGDLSVTGAIYATTGLQPVAFPAAGNGGTVTLESSTGTVSVSGKIEVSSNDPTPFGSPTPPPVRRSARGGKINLTSGKTGTSPANSRAVAINIADSGQLLSLLAAAPTPRPGGKVTILATGANSDINVAGKIQATGGTVDIRHRGTAGNINLVGTAGVPNTSILSADVIKAGAFGDNGQLNVGRSTLSADTLIRLYATGANGELNFIANTTLASGNAIQLAASKITIQPSVVVTINGPQPADVYTNNPNYSGPGGINPNNGRFGGQGAKMPQTLDKAPLFDSPAPSPPPLGSPHG